MSSAACWGLDRGGRQAEQGSSATPQQVSDKLLRWGRRTVQVGACGVASGWGTSGRAGIHVGCDAASGLGHGGGQAGGKEGVREQLLRVYIRRVRVLVGWTLGPKVLAIGPRT